VLAEGGGRLGEGDADLGEALLARGVELRAVAAEVVEGLVEEAARGRRSGRFASSVSA
jgi:hypothetical protein